MNIPKARGDLAKAIADAILAANGDLAHKLIDISNQLDHADVTLQVTLNNMKEALDGVYKHELARDINELTEDVASVDVVQEDAPVVPAVDAVEANDTVADTPES